MRRPQPDSIRKILILSPSLQSIGGVQTYTRQLFAGISVVLAPENVRIVSIAADPEARPDGATLPALAKLRFLIRCFTSSLAFRPDTIVCMHIGIAPLARAISRITRKPYWLVLHGIEVWGDLPEAKLRALRDADRSIVLSCFTLQTASMRHALAQKDALLLPPYFEPVASQNHLPADSVSHIVLTVGRLSASERYKGHDAMLEAWPAIVKRMPDAVYWIVGDGDDRPRLQAKATQLGVSNSVKFFGNLTGANLEACYARCDVFAMPAQSAPSASPPQGEGFGLVYIEALAHGKPVLAANDGAPAEFLRNGEFGLLVNPASVREITDALVALLTDRERSQRMGAAGKTWVETELSFEKFCERLRLALCLKSRKAA